MFPEPLQQVDRVLVRYRGRKLIYFGGCDYLRLSSDPRIITAVAEGLRRDGLNVAASRRTTGNHPLYERLEREAAKFFRHERAVLVSNGYMSNLVVAQGLAGKLSRVLIDEHAHGSLKDATRFLGLTPETFRHRDPNDLAAKIKKMGKGSRLAILSDGIFSHSGAVAPLAEYRRVAGPEALLWVDDSHGCGMLGAQGRGTVEWAGLERRNLIQTVTFSKAFGVYGGAVLCARVAAEAIIARSNCFIGNTPLPLPLVSGVRTSLRIIREQPSLRRRLWDNAQVLWELAGLPSAEPRMPIMAVTPKRSHAAAMREELLKSGIYPSYIEYPGGEAKGFFRFAVSSEHSVAQIRTLGQIIGGWVREGLVK